MQKGWRYSGDYVFTEVPRGFRYPESYIRLVSQSKIIDIRPWWLTGKRADVARLCMQMISQKTGNEKTLIPFAKCDESGDFACFDGDDCSGNPRIFFYCGETSLKGINWEKRYSVSDFSTWIQGIKATN